MEIEQFGSHNILICFHVFAFIRLFFILSLGSIYIYIYMTVYLLFALQAGTYTLKIKEIK